jgi:hypothetical protein
MSIPPFDHNNVLPAHNGEQTSKIAWSPYPCTILEFCQRFNTSPLRQKLLLKLIDFRLGIDKNGLRSGFQWIGGSFVTNKEDIDANNPNPGDIDLITLFYGKDNTFFNNFDLAFPSFADAKLARDLFHLDHYIVPIEYLGIDAIDDLTYWLQLFTTSKSGVRKGIVKIELNTPDLDLIAKEFILSTKV